MNPRIGIKDIDFYERNWNDEKELHPEITGNKTFYVILAVRGAEIKDFFVTLQRIPKGTQRHIAQ